MGKTISLADREHCTGCGACKAICPKSAIIFKPDSEGFPSPIIDGEKCVKCGLCEKTCPAIHMPETHPIQASYAVQLLDRDALQDSTSGGVFTALSREIFRRGGVVYGCVWDAEYNAVIRRAENEEEIKPMRGSKYVWSWAGDAFPEVKKDLEAGLTVLFTGLPCQVAGLKNYLRKDYANLYLTLFFCGGAPSPLAFHEYLNTITKDIPLEKLDFMLRDKKRDGVGVHISYNTPNGRTYESYVQNSYFFSYHTKVCHRRSCFHCQYRYEQRIGDLTFGDYWEISKYHKEFNVRAGVSSLLISTEKGAELFDAVKNQFQYSETKVKDIAGWNNLTLGEQKKEFHIPEFRDAFFEILKEKGWTSAERKYLYNKKRLILWLKTKLSPKYVDVIKRIIRRR